MLQTSIDTDRELIEKLQNENQQLRGLLAAEKRKNGIAADWRDRTEKILFNAKMNATCRLVLLCVLSAIEGVVPDRDNLVTIHLIKFSKVIGLSRDTVGDYIHGLYQAGVLERDYYGESNSPRTFIAVQKTAIVDNYPDRIEATPRKSKKLSSKVAAATICQECLSLDVLIKKQKMTEITTICNHCGHQSRIFEDNGSTTHEKRE